MKRKTQCRGRDGLWGCTSLKLAVRFKKPTYTFGNCFGKIAFNSPKDFARDRDSWLYKPNTQ